MLRQCGAKVEGRVEFHVNNGSPDVRHMIVPTRPQETEALSEAELAVLVTRDSPIGVGDPLLSNSK